MAFSASLASRMYLSRTRLSQMRRGGAPRTGRPRESSSKDSRSSGAGHSRRESRAEREAGTCRRRGGLDVHAHPSRCSAPASPPDPNLASAQALPPLPSFNPAAACTPHPPATGIHFSRPNFNPGVTEASPLADPGCCSQTQVSAASSPT